MEIECTGNILSWFAVSSAICAHILSTLHMDVQESWYKNKWFWVGLLGNLPALVAMMGHLHLKKLDRSEPPSLTE